MTTTHSNSRYIVIERVGNKLTGETFAHERLMSAQEVVDLILSGGIERIEKIINATVLADETDRLIEVAIKRWFDVSALAEIPECLRATITDTNTLDEINAEIAARVLVAAQREADFLRGLRKGEVA